MPIKYYLTPNAVTPDPNDQFARVEANAVLNEDDIIMLMLRRGTTVTETDVRAVITLYNQVVTDSLNDGNFVNTYLANYRPGISGVFTNPNDSFDAARHTKKVTVSPGIHVNRAIQSAAVQKVSSTQPTPILSSFIDYGSDSDSALTPGGTAEISGEQLKFDTANPAEGIFLIATDASENKADGTLIRHTQGTLIFTVPDSLASGTYRLEVRKGFGTTNVNIRSGQYDTPLTVI